MGLTIVLNTSINEYYCSSTNGYGFKVLLNRPNELPEIENYGIGIANEYESRIIASPILSTASKAIRSVSIDVRKCYFDNENFLTLYR